MALWIIVKAQLGNQFYYVEVESSDFIYQEHCLIQTDKGSVLARVVKGATEMDTPAAKPIGKIIRKATPEDLEQHKRNLEMEQQAYVICQQKIKERGLVMKLLRVEYSFDRNKATFYFTAEGRIDFRELVRDLAYEFRTRIEMKQIGIRDEAKIMGGYGCCGRKLCCTSFIDNFDPVSIRMAKAQCLTLDPGKISGVCGRLMCCLEYEYPVYEESRKKLPRLGEKVIVAGETGRVKSLDVLAEMVYVEFEDARVIKVKAGEISRVDKDKPPKAA